MGTWGFNLFDDDSACDTLASCLERDNLLNEIMPTFLEFKDALYLEAEEVVEILVYAFLLSGLIDKSFITELPDEKLSPYFKGKVLEFIEKNQNVWDLKSILDRNSLIELCKSCFPTIKDPKKSELYALWEESSEDYLSKWLNSVDLISSGLKEYRS